MEKLWQVMGKLKEAPKEKRFNDTWTENTIILTDKPVSANYKRIYHIIKSQNPLVEYIGPVAKYLNCKCCYNEKEEYFSATCCEVLYNPEFDLTKVDIPIGTKLLVSIKVNGKIHEKKTKFISVSKEQWYEWIRKDGNPLYLNKLFMDGLFEHERESLDFRY
jgi:predicted DNA-binding antitoxin AbrB/MazE fold protein